MRWEYTALFICGAGAIPRLFTAWIRAVTSEPPHSKTVRPGYSTDAYPQTQTFTFEPV